MLFKKLSAHTVVLLFSVVTTTTAPHRDQIVVNVFPNLTDQHSQSVRPEQHKLSLRGKFAREAETLICSVLTS